MDAAHLVMILLLAVGLSEIASRTALRFLPLPLLQILLGIAMSLPPLNMQVRLDPAIFFLIFIPPLLFNDGWRIPNRELFELRHIVLALAFGLVMATVILIGHLIHWLMPEVPLVVCFALSALLSPTDAVAVGALAGRMAIPPRLLYLLQGEALLNDASGLVAFQFALTAALTGHFSTLLAAWALLKISLGGWLIGYGCSRAMQKILGWVVASPGSSPATQILIVLLVPFGAYLLAERLHVSGILAVVAAGITLSRFQIDGASQFSVRLHGRALFEMLEFILNGIVFIVLGLQLPHIVQVAHQSAFEYGDLWHMLRNVALITLSLMVLRFCWIGPAIVIRRRFSADRKSVQAGPFFLTLVATFAGIRGAVTLAGVISIPLVGYDGADFPARDQLIFIAAGVILATLVIGSVGLPLVLRRARLAMGDDDLEHEKKRARILAAEAAIRAVERMTERILHQDTHEKAAITDVSAEIIAGYRQRIEEYDDRKNSPSRRLSSEIERSLRRSALYGERQQLYHLHRRAQINDVTLRELQHAIDLEEGTLHPGKPLDETELEAEILVGKSVQID